MFSDTTKPTGLSHGDACTGFIAEPGATFGNMADDAPRRAQWLRDFAVSDYVVILPLIAVVFAWIGFIIGIHKRGPTSTFSTSSFIALAAVLLLSLLAGLIRLREPTTSGLISNALLFLVVLNMILLMFSSLYWSYGTAHNFNHPLRRLDSIYFAAGTLTTVGTGNLVATSETARSIQLAQMLLDFVLVVVVVGLFFLRFGQYSKRRDPDDGQSPVTSVRQVGKSPRHFEAGRP